MKYKLLRIGTQSYANPVLKQLRVVFEKKDGTELQRHIDIPDGSTTKIVAERLRDLAFEIENMGV